MGKRGECWSVRGKFVTLQKSIKRNEQDSNNSEIRVSGFGVGRSCGACPTFFTAYNALHGFRRCSLRNHCVRSDVEEIWA